MNAPNPNRGKGDGESKPADLSVGDGSAQEQVERGRFQETRWSLVLRAQDATEGTAHRALSTLCEMYWYPLYAFARRSGHGPEDAEDLTQGFFADLLKRRLFDDVAPERGKLRSYLLKAMRNFMNKRRAHDQAEKRGGPYRHVPIDPVAAEDRYYCEPADELTPKVVYERHWTLSLLEHARRRLEAEYVRRGKFDLFQALKGFLSVRKPDRPYADVAREFGMSEGAVKVTAHRLRERYRELVEEEISHTVESPDEIEEEIRHLFGVFGGTTPPA